MWDEPVAQKIMSYDDAVYFARKRAPKGIFNAYQAGSGPNITASANESVFGEVLFKPHAGVFTTDQDPSTTVAGFALKTPLILSSVGGLRGAHRDGELAATHAANEFGGMQFVSGMTTTPIEEIVKAATAPVFQQIYFVGSRAQTAPILERAVAAGVDGLTIVVDSAAPGRGGDTPPNKRYRIPTKVSLREAVGFLPQIWNRPAWALDFLFNGLNAPTVQYVNDERGKPMPYAQAAGMLYNQTPTFEDIPWIREYWDGPLILKGIIRPDDARRAVDAGADAIVVSNHGGNMLDTTIPTLRALPGVVDAVGDQVDVLLDGGIRRGSDVVKAMAMGAKAVGIGRAYVNGLLAAGEPGVMRMVGLLREQMIDTLRFLGVDTPAEIDGSFLEFPPHWSGLTRDQLLGRTDDTAAPALDDVAREAVSR